MIPETTIITPIYNAEEFLEETLQSILDQSYSHWESILINDNSTDKSLNIANKFVALDSRFKIINNKVSGGAAKARNSGIEIAEGRFIAFLDSDDIWAKDKLEKQIKYMKINAVGFTYTNYSQFGDVVNSNVNILAPKKLTYSQLVKANYIGCLTVVYDVLEFGKFYFPLTKKRHDFALWLSMLKQFDYAYNVDESLANYRVHGNSLSSNKKDAFQSYFYILHNIEGINKITSICYTVRFSLLSIIKKKYPSLYRLVLRRVDSSSSIVL
ncbi:glycosyltransferase family 2 protein [Colwellia sp. BRX9-1]|uniref:glycosyltransferase family 2 protein n=1 Tax=Colwellia sp. BRX9-1 TaxID=2759830 RepID=UPI0015F71618|nr:glycosyltransferase family 2 protein [Colwellia sp. BRX9-1]MBA6353594.1 glycosyltransferase family 2 protein [Colwellia sp. BRX9-1]